MRNLYLDTNTFVTSDLHIGDPGVAKRRYFGNDVQAHDDFIAAWWDKNVTEEDSVLLLGDILIGNLEEGLDWISRRPGMKLLISGNWDPTHPMHDPSEIVTGYSEVFEWVDSRAKVMIKDQRPFLANHYPYPGLKPHPTNQWRLKDEGIPLLHGHTHKRQKYSLSAKGTPQHHVGWDAWRRMPTLGQIVLPKWEL